MSRYVKEIMTINVYTIGPYESVKKAEAIMWENNIGGLPVVLDDKLVGIITSKDIRRAHPNRIVADAMTKEVITITANSTIWEAKELMEKKNIERLPVIHNDQLVGIITKAKLIEEVSKHIDILTSLPKSQFIIEKAVELLRKESDFTVIFIDVNNFGVINKDNGHIIGDQILLQLGMLLKDQIDENCYLCRFGGDEFLILYDGSLERAITFANKIIKSTKEYKWLNDLKIDLTIGIAGGRRTGIRPGEDLRYNILNLINLASLASSQGKRENVSIKVVDCVSCLTQSE
jgi:diguanylate cyclase (GGDEF)-like protein